MDDAMDQDELMALAEKEIEDDANNFLEDIATEITQPKESTATEKATAATTNEKAKQSAPLAHTSTEDSESDSDEAMEVNGEITDDGDGEEPDVEPQTGDESSDAESESSHVRNDRSGVLHARRFIDDEAAESSDGEDYANDLAKRVRKKKIQDEDEYDTGGKPINEYESEGLAAEDEVEYETGVESEDDRKSRKKHKHDKARKKSKKSKRRYTDSDDESESSEDEDVKRKSDKKRKKAVTSDADDDDEHPPPKKAKSQRVVADEEEIEAMMKASSKNKHREAAGYGDYADVKGANEVTAAASSSSQLKSPVKSKSKKKSDVKLKSPLKQTRNRQTATAVKLQIGKISTINQKGYVIWYIPKLKATMIPPEAKGSRWKLDKSTITIDHLGTAEQMTTSVNSRGATVPNGTMEFFVITERSLLKPIILTNNDIETVWKNSMRVMDQAAYCRYANEALSHKNVKETQVDSITMKQRFFTEQIYDRIYSEARATGTWQPANVRISAESAELLEPPGITKMVKSSPKVKKQVPPKLTRKPEKNSHDVSKLLQQPSKPVIKATVVAKPTAPPTNSIAKTGVLSLDDDEEVVEQSRVFSARSLAKVKEFMNSLVKRALNGNPEKLKQMLETHLTNIEDCMTDSQDPKVQHDKFNASNTPAIPHLILMATLPFILPEYTEAFNKRLTPEKPKASNQLSFD